MLMQELLHYKYLLLRIATLLSSVYMRQHSMQMMMTNQRSNDTLSGVEALLNS